MEEVVLGGARDEAGRVLELGGPLLNGSDIVTHVSARGNVHLEVVDESLKVLESLNEVKVLDVLESIGDIVEERLGASVAGLHLREVVLTNHAVDETSSDLRGSEKVNLVGVGRDGDRAETNVEDISGGLAGLEVLLSVPVGLDGGNIVSDLLVVEDHGLGNLLGSALGVLEDGGPLAESLELRAHVLASREHGGDHTGNLLSKAGSLDHVLGLNGLDELLDLGSESLSIGGASLDLIEVVLTDKTVENTSKELNGSLDVGKAVGSLVKSGLHGANSEHEGISGVLASIEVVGSGPVGLLLIDILADLAAVEEPVLGDGLGESSGLGENLGPVLNLSDVLIHALASGHGRADLVPDDTGILDGLEVVASLEVADGELGVSDDLVTTLVAGLNLREVVVTSHGEHEASDEVRDRHDVKGGGRSGEAGSSESFHS